MLTMWNIRCHRRMLTVWTCPDAISRNHVELPCVSLVETTEHSSSIEVKRVRALECLALLVTITRRLSLFGMASLCLGMDGMGADQERPFVVFVPVLSSRVSPWSETAAHSSFTKAKRVRALECPHLSCPQVPPVNFLSIQL